jgi:DNA-binding transcriptional ArsR family regulator
MNGDDRVTRELLACMGNASRFRLVQALADGSRCVSELAREVGLSQSCTTRHLQALERGGLVARARDGKRVMVRLSGDEPALSLLAWALGHGAMPAGLRDEPGGGDVHRDRPRTTMSNPPGDRSAAKASRVGRQRDASGAWAHGPGGLPMGPPGPRLEDEGGEGLRRNEDGTRAGRTGPDVATTSRAGSPPASEQAGTAQPGRNEIEDYLL